MNKYKNIINILSKQVENGVKALWTFDEKNKEFTNIYKNYNDKLPIYTPQQLLDKLKEL
jgi:hypothetical protein